MTAALIIAAGRTDTKDRFSPEKKVGTITAIERIVLQLQGSGIRRIAVICGEDEQPKKLVPSMSLVFLTAPEDGDMLESVKTGLRYLQDKSSEVLVSYVDVPMFSRDTVKKLISAQGEVNIPSYKGKCGHPLLIKKVCFEGILNYDGKDGLKGAVNASGAKKKIVEVDDSGILALNGETEADGDFKKMRMTYKIRLSREKVFYGTGVHQLLGLIEEQGSLLEACRYMNISYSKGRKIIHTMEEQLNTAMLETQNGGRGGGYSRLTDKAKELMRNYEDFNNEAKVVLEDLFEKYFEAYKY